MSTLRITLACALLVLAALSAIAGDPNAPLARDEIDALTLAAQIQARQSALLLIDLRDDSDQAGKVSGSIPGARSITALAGQSLPPTAVLVLVDRSDVERSAVQRVQAQWPRASVLRLRGGLEAWQREVLYPTLRADASERQRAAFAARAKLSRYFGGSATILDPGTAASTTRSRQGC